MQPATCGRCVALVCNHVLWDSGTVAQARSAGLRCLSYTVNEQPLARRLVPVPASTAKLRRLRWVWEQRIVAGGRSELAAAAT